jgi:hypothetical protein
VKRLLSLATALRGIPNIEERLSRIQEALGRIEARQLAAAEGMREAEFQVYSQWGEDGIVQWLLRHVSIDKRLFVEFGVGDYSEANTRFLLVAGNWSGLVMDSSAAHIERLRRDPIYWRHNLKSDCALVTAENVDALLARHGVEGDIGLLSIDIDGNDYWVWRALTPVRPAIVIVEYNARFGAERAVTVPYDPRFDRRRAHYSGIYYGASLAALARLAERKGYALVGCNSGGNNAFFVRREHLGGALAERTPGEAYVAAAFREARDPAGNLAFLSAQQEQALLEGLPLVEVDGA